MPRKRRVDPVDAKRRARHLAQYRHLSDEEFEAVWQAKGSEQAPPFDEDDPEFASMWQAIKRTLEGPQTQVELLAKSAARAELIYKRVQERALKNPGSISASELNNHSLAASRTREDLRPREKKSETFAAWQVLVKPDGPLDKALRMDTTALEHLDSVFFMAVDDEAPKEVLAWLEARMEKAKDPGEPHPAFAGKSPDEVIEALEEVARENMSKFPPGYFRGIRTGEDLETDE